MHRLRPYQSTAVDQIRAAYRDGVRSVVYQLPTGGGKSLVFAHIMQAVAARNRRVWLVVHRKELVRQASALLTDLGVPHGVVMGGQASASGRCVQVCSVASAVRRLERMGEVDLIVVDEAHHVLSDTYLRVLAARPAARILGVTATPARLDGRGLGQAFQRLIIGPSIQELVTDGYLAPTTVYAPPLQADLSTLRIRAGDFDLEQVAGRMDKPHITGDAIEHYRRLADRLPAICFAVSLVHAEHVAEAFRAAGYQAARIDGTQTDETRQALIADLGAGRLRVLVSCELIGEGVDIPVVSAAILLRPTASLTVHLQQIGRAMRPAPGKARALVLDHVGNTLRHGLPDEPREWSLDGKRRKVRADSLSAVPMRQCKTCFCCHRPAPACPECGFQYPILARAPEVVAGELVPMLARPAGPVARQEVGRATSRQALEAIARARGYAPGWVDYILRARQKSGTSRRVDPHATIREWKGEAAR